MTEEKLNKLAFKHYPYSETSRKIFIVGLQLGLSMQKKQPAKKKHVAKH